VAAFADGVIVGSAFVRRLDEQGIPAIRDLTAELAASVRRPATQPLPPRTPPSP
jgi:tryptophan synthase alpha chain